MRNCIGIECNRSSIDDALANCKINDVHNCEFTFGKVEEVKFLLTFKTCKYEKIDDEEIF